MAVRETLQEKAGRLLAAGRLRVHEVRADRITATIHGDTGTYRLGWHPRVRSGWYCTCPATADPCAHLLVLQAVTDAPQRVS